MGLFLRIMVCICILTVCNSENDTFVPTKDWQQIKEGQSIPAGLHVRINLETGKKEAKLIDEQSDGKQNALSPLPEDSNNESNTNAPPKPKISKNLEEALKHLPKHTLSLEYAPQKLEEIQKKFKTYKELKRNYNDMKINFKTDAEIISALIQECKNITKDPSMELDFLRILENLNYLVHRMENALWFIDEGGLDSVVLPIIVNQTNIALRVKSLRILGALTQNNPNAQISVYEKNFGSYLTQILITSTNTDELSTSLYAFGSMLRKFPHAQSEILSKFGIKALTAVLSKDAELKIKAKAMTLISDLIVERDLTLSILLRDSYYNREKIEEYKGVHIDIWLKENQFCEIVDDLVTNSKSYLLNQPDITDYFIQALHSTSTQNLCFPIWSKSPMLRHTLLTIKNRYENSQEEYLIEISQKVKDLIVLLYGKIQERDEL